MARLQLPPEDPLFREPGGPASPIEIAVALLLAAALVVTIIGLVLVEIGLGPYVFWTGMAIVGLFAVCGAAGVVGGMFTGR